VPRCVQAAKISDGVARPFRQSPLLPISCFARTLVKPALSGCAPLAEPRSGQLPYGAPSSVWRGGRGRGGSCSHKDATRSASGAHPEDAALPLLGLDESFY
jgi:hypothetical protein